MPFTSPHSPRQNALLAALPFEEFAALMPSLELVAVPLGEALCAPGQPMHHAFFPTTAVVSLHGVTREGTAAETTGVGRDGMVGIELFMGGQTSTGHAVVQSAGHGWRIARAPLQLAFDRQGQLRGMLLRYTLALITQTGQSVACYRHHTVEQQLSRWLLAAMARLPAGEMVMTQELAAGLLGVRRESITQAAGHLQDGGYIRYRRGHITVLDPAGLEGRACECFGVVRQELRRLLDCGPPRILEPA